MSGEALALVRLLQLASPTLPIGAYSYSQGLEWVIANGTVCDATSAERWIGDLLEHVIARGEAAVAWRLLSAAQDAEWTVYGQWNAWLRALRETAELRAETEQMGGSLIKLALDLELLDGSAREALTAFDPITLPGAYAPPRGRLLLAGAPAEAFGCIALRPLDPTAACGELPAKQAARLTATTSIGNGR